MDGAGSIWNGRKLTLGFYGDGALVVANGGKLVATDKLEFIGHAAGHQDAAGSVLLQSGGVIETANVMRLGNLGSATFTFDGGILRLTADQASLFGGETTAVAVNFAAGGGTIDTQAFAVAISRELTGSGQLTKTGSGTLTLSGADLRTAGMTLEAGTLRQGAAGAFAASRDYVVNGGTFDLNDIALTMSSLAGSGGAIDLGTARLSLDQSTDTTFAGGIFGSGGITKLNSGTLTLTGALNYSGSTIIDNGTLVLDGVSVTLTGDTKIISGVGNDREAELVIRNGSVVHQVGGLSVSNNPTQTGRLSVDGAGTQLTTNGYFDLGVGGNAEVSVTNGARVIADGSTYMVYWVYVGVPSRATLLVDGRGTIWTQNGLFQAGRQGSAEITVSNGAVMELNDFIGWGHVTLTLDGGTIRTLRESTQYQPFLGGFSHYYGTDKAVLAAGGGTIDSNGFTIETDALFSGPGGLTKPVPAN